MWQVGGRGDSLERSKQLSKPGSFEFKLPKSCQDKVEDARAADKGDAQEVLVEDFSITITRHDMRSLRDGGYLNDAVIYFFMLVCVRVYL